MLAAAQSRLIVPKARISASATPVVASASLPSDAFSGSLTVSSRPTLWPLGIIYRQDYVSVGGLAPSGETQRPFLLRQAILTVATMSVGGGSDLASNPSLIDRRRESVPLIHQDLGTQIRFMMWPPSWPVFINTSRVGGLVRANVTIMPTPTCGIHQYLFSAAHQTKEINGSHRSR